MILIGSVYVKDKNYYPQVFSEKYKHIVINKKRPYFITDTIEIYSNDSDLDEKTEIKKKVHKFVCFFKKSKNMINIFFKRK